MITFSDNTGDEYKSEITGSLPQWKTHVLDLQESTGVPGGKQLNFLVEARSKDEFSQWLAQYEEMTKTNYSIRTTEPASGKLVTFKQRLVCRHNTRLQRTHDPAVHKITKNTNCSAKMTVTIHAARDGYKGKFTEKAQFYKELPCEINLTQGHNHSVGSAASLKFRQPSSEVQEKLITLFQRGHSPASALECIKTEIQLNFPEYPLIFADKSRCPTYDFCYYFYTKLFKKNYGPMNFDDQGKKFLQHRLEEYNNEAGMVCSKMVVHGDDYVICICSPLMKKVHLLIPAASQMAFIDSTGSLDHDGSRVFVLLTHSECGGLPLGIIVTSSESCEILEIGFQILKDIVGENIFGGNIKGPSVFITDDSQAEQNAIRRCFPSSRILLCVFHVLQAVWRWLLKSKNGIPQEKQVEFFQNFKMIMYARTKHEAEANYETAKGNVSKKYENYLKYLEGYWARREQWAISYRIGILIKGHNTNNMCEAFMKILKDNIFERVRAFNVVQLIDYIVTKVNLYFQRRLLDAANKTNRRSFCRSIKVPSAEILSKIKQVNGDIILVPSENTMNHYYIVNLSVLICTCLQGNTGKLCKHIDWASSVYPTEKYMETIDTDHMRKIYHFIVTGEEPPENWLEPLCGFQTDTGLNVTCNLELVDAEMLNKESEVVPCKMDVEKVPDPMNEHLINGIQTLLTDFSKRSPDEMRPGLQAIFEKLKKIKTPSACASALLTFGEGQSRKNRRNYIPVQPTAIGRRKKNLRGRRSHVGGRPRKSVSKNKEVVTPEFSNTLGNYNDAL